MGNPLFKLTKVISGGQTGADIAGVDAAKLYCLNTGGWMPKYWRTLRGYKPEYAKLYGMREHSSQGYRDRTEDNVLMADATVRFFHKKNSAGERCTYNELNAIILHGKPYFDVNFQELLELPEHEALESGMLPLSFYNWLKDNEFTSLNVAGNSEQTAPGIYQEVFTYLCYVFAHAGLEQQV
jgi:hypothetical protein